MKKFLCSIFAALFVTSSVLASSPITVNGKFAGVAFATSFDLDADGNNARTFDVPAYDQIVFTALQGAFDATLVALPGLGTCSDPAAFELKPVGNIILRSHGANALYAVVDSSHHLCFNPANPNEVAYVTISGGRGIFAGKTGTGTFHLHDTQIIGNSSGFPLVVDTVGEFSVTFQ